MKGLLIVDPQVDFISGTLPVPGAQKAMDELAAWLAQNAANYAEGFVSLDSHPQNHCSFKDNGGQWPRHCVAGSFGAQIWPSLKGALLLLPAVQLLHKGTCAEREEYSFFQNQAARDNFRQQLEANEIDSLDICGLAGDVCVLNTLKDGVDIFGRNFLRVLMPFSPSLDGGAALSAFISSAQVARA